MSQLPTYLAFDQHGVRWHAELISEDYPMEVFLSTAGHGVRGRIVEFRPQERRMDVKFLGSEQVDLKLVLDDVVR